MILPAVTPTYHRPPPVALRIGATPKITGCGSTTASESKIHMGGCMEATAGVSEGFAQWDSLIRDGTVHRSRKELVPQIRTNETLRMRKLTLIGVAVFAMLFVSPSVEGKEEPEDRNRYSITLGEVKTRDGVSMAPSVGFGYSVTDRVGVSMTYNERFTLKGKYRLFSNRQLSPYVTIGVRNANPIGVTVGTELSLKVVQNLSTKLSASMAFEDREENRDQDSVSVGLKFSIKF